MVRKNIQPYQRAKNKAAFLSAYASCCVIYKACEMVNIDVGTVRYWLNTGFMQQSELDAAQEQYRDRIRYVIHELAVEGTNIPLNDGHGHILLDSSGNPVMRNTKDIKVLLKLAEKFLPEFKDDSSGYTNGHTSNTAININIGTSVHDLYSVFIDLHGWNVDDVRELKALIMKAESHKQLPEQNQNVIIDSQ